MKKSNNPSGFTLIELLIVIAVVAILATVVFVAIDPVARFEDARNTRRWTDVNSVLSAIKLYQVDNTIKNISDADPDQGIGISTMSTTSYYMIGGATTGCNVTCTYEEDDGTLQTLSPFLAACFDLANLVDRGYIGKEPKDPSETATDKSGYYIKKMSNGQLRVGSCYSEMGSAGIRKKIEVVR